MIGFLFSYIFSTLISIAFVAILIVAIVAASKNMWKTGTIDRDAVLAEMKEIYEDTKARAFTPEDDDLKKPHE